MSYKNIAWSIIGLAAPLLTAGITIPLLMDQLGLEKFGLLALCWGLLSYASIFDLGIGRALTQMISTQIGQKKFETIPQLLYTATRITLISGVVGAFILIIASFTPILEQIKLETTSLDELTYSLLLFSIILPVQAMSATYRGVNEAFHNFKNINLIRIGLGVVNFVGPLVMSYYTTKLYWLISSLLVSRLIGLAFFKILAWTQVQNKNHELYFNKEQALKLFKFGGWASVSNIIGPLFMQLDRFIIAFVLSASAVSLYAVPFEITTQTLFIVTAISVVFFPSLTQEMNNNPDGWKKLFYKWLIVISLSMFVLTSALALLFPTFLELWLSDRLTPESALIGQALCLGVFFNSIGSVFFTLLHAKSRSDITAKIHLVEVPIFCVVLYYSIVHFGLMGAAISWSLRTFFDTSALAIASYQYLRGDPCQSA